MTEETKPYLLDKASYNEKELLLKIAEGDEYAFTHFYKHYYKIIQPFVAKNSSSPDATRDILQMTFLRVWLNRHKLEGIENVKAWLIKIASREYLTYVRDNISKQLKSLEIEDAERNIGVQGVGQIGYGYTVKEIKNLVAEAMKNLSPQRRQIFQLSRGENLSINEIAGKLQLAPKTIKNTLTAALKEIASYLQLHGYELVIIIALLTP